MTVRRYRPPQHWTLEREAPVPGRSPGLRAGRRTPDLRLPMRVHSGVVQALDSSTVAGAAPALDRLPVFIPRRDLGNLERAEQ